MRTIVVGGQYGDEGKGKILSYLARVDKPKIVARGGVGPNAGHIVVYKGEKFALRLVPCGFVNENARLLIGPGVLINPEVFLKEVAMVKGEGRTGIDRNAAVITKEHIERDRDANARKIGTTGSGCGPAMADRVSRVGLRVSDVPELQKYLCDVPIEVNSTENVLIEGSQGFMLSNYGDSYPYVTSKDITASSVAADVGLGPTKIDEVVMVIKAYTTRVGNGPFRDEISIEEAEKLGYQEYGTVTGRARRTSPHLHFKDLRRAAMVNGATQVAITKLDVVFKENVGARVFEELTREAREFVATVERMLGTEVTLIGTGPDAKDTIDMRIRE